MSGAPAYPDDIFSDSALADPYPHYAALRELGPVVWLEAHQMYALTRYAEVRAALTDAETFCSGRGVALNDTTNAMAAGRNLLMTDGDLHSHLRRVLAQNLTPRAIRFMEEEVDLIAREVVEALVARRAFDAVVDLARALPLRVVPDLVGWPEDGREHLLEWAGATFDLLGPLNERAQRAVPLMQAMQQFAATIAADGNLMPGSVGAGVIEAARRGDIEPERVPPLIVGYLAPSLDTTISAIGSAIWLFANHPQQWDAVRADRTLVPNAFNEVVRIESPIRAFSRVATAPVTIAGVDVPEGARLMLLYASANRDDRHFADADRFDVARPNAVEQLGFGVGVHSCAGQGLARMEAHALLAALAARVDRFELAGPPVKGLNNLINAFATLPVTVRPAAEGDS